MPIKDRLTEEQKIRYDQLYIMSKIAYPDLLEQMYEDAIYFYLVNGEDDLCFQKLVDERNKNPNNILDNEILQTS